MDLIERDAVLHDLSTECSNAHEAKYYEAQVALTRAKRIICDAPAVNRWIPCSERLPEQSGVYLAYFTFKDGTHATDIAYINTGCHLGSITHWMPLPEPPENGEIP